VQVIDIVLIIDARFPKGMPVAVDTKVQKTDCPKLDVSVVVYFLDLFIRFLQYGQKVELIEFPCQLIVLGDVPRGFGQPVSSCEFLYYFRFIHIFFSILQI